jgi:hypothetical protein
VLKNKIDFFVFFMKFVQLDGDITQRKNTNLLWKSEKNKTVKIVKEREIEGEREQNKFFP